MLLLKAFVRYFAWSVTLGKFTHESQQLDWLTEVADELDWYKFSMNQSDSGE